MTCTNSAGQIAPDALCSDEKPASSETESCGHTMMVVPMIANGGYECTGNEIPNAYYVVGGKDGDATKYSEKKLYSFMMKMNPLPVCIQEKYKGTTKSGDEMFFKGFTGPMRQTSTKPAASPYIIDGK